MLKPGDIVEIEYKFGSNGPWNYMFEKPPDGVQLVRHIGIFVEETSTHILTASSFSVFSDGSTKPTHIQHWTKDVTIRRVDEYRSGLEAAAKAIEVVISEDAFGDARSELRVALDRIRSLIPKE